MEVKTKSNIKNFGELMNALKRKKKPNFHSRLMDLSDELREERIYQKRMKAKAQIERQKR
jgi:hypothetical protein